MTGRCTSRSPRFRRTAACPSSNAASSKSGRVWRATSTTRRVPATSRCGKPSTKWTNRSARDLQEQGVDAGTFRTLVYQTHYRQPHDYTDEALDGARKGSLRLGKFRERLANGDGQGRTGTDGSRLAELAQRLEPDVRAALDDDLDSPKALAHLFDFVTAGNAELDRAPGGRGAAAALAVFDGLLELFAVLPAARPVDPALAQWVPERLAARDRARKSKDFKEADRIRAELKARGVEIEDTPAGTKWRVV